MSTEDEQRSRARFDYAMNTRGWMRFDSAVPESRSRANTLFGLHVWGGNATGAFLMSWTLAQSGWLAVCGVALTAALIALLIHRGILPVGNSAERPT